MLKSRRTICFVLTAEFAVKVFLLNHLRVLSSTYDMTVVVNTDNPRFLEELGIKVNVIPLKIQRNIHLLSDISALIQLIKLFHQAQFSAVHSITPKAGLLAMMAGWLTRVPLRVHTFTGQVWATRKGFKRFVLKLLDRLIAFLATHNIVDSPSQCDFLINERVVNRVKSLVFGKGSISGVDINRFKADKEVRAIIRKQLNITDDAVMFLFLGRLTKDKGVLDLAQAFSMAHDVNTHLIFAGPDEQNMVESIKRITQNNPFVHFVGYTDRPEGYMAASDVICLPSYREGFGSVIIEAAAVGIPAVASNIYGISDAVVDGQTGLLHNPHDTDAIRECMERLINDSSLRLKLGKKANIRAINDFDSNLITEKWVRFYRENLN